MMLRGVRIWGAIVSIALLSPCALHAEAVLTVESPLELQEVAKGKQLLWERGIAHKRPVTDDLGKEYRSDGVHFNQLGLTTHAERWFAALSVEYKWGTGTSRTSIDGGNQ